ncbi:uncharacterized protein LAESUDRAFT_719002 [Laetiporus sulphureus 93-53]|uniref:Uncharacterized protein n=1 Tax=Laetiporus sulphureus 93-53 TaxID=1314785 RepID=A0A165I813_9APHY|nr:uncharacterized protein LAESUDRAFT_719002 [Laetiporus sulphureus 93-53]KZT12710.1 hypothetical protein LAESUDRAFT_719002 [Laetiporus sulphureus 93-53]
MFELWNQARASASSKLASETTPGENPGVNGSRKTSAPSTRIDSGFEPAQGSVQTSRARLASEVDASLEEPLARSNKRRRTSWSSNIPENINDDVPWAYPTLTAKAILEETQIHNVVAITEDSAVKKALLTNFFARSAESRRYRLAAGLLHDGLNLLVVENDAGISQYHADLASSGYISRIGQHASCATDEDGNWFEQSGTDVIIVSHHALMESVVEGALLIAHVSTLVLGGFWPDCEEFGRLYRAVNVASRPRILAFMPHVGSQPPAFLEFQRYTNAQVCYVVADEVQTPSARRLEGLVENVVTYQKLCCSAARTPLSTKLREVDNEGSIPPHLFKRARTVLTELGLCAEELFWKLALSSTPTHEVRDGVIGLRATPTKAIREVIKRWSFKVPCLDSASRNSNLSPKFARFVEELKGRNGLGGSNKFRIFVIVQKKAIATMLVELLNTLPSQPGQPSFRPMTLSGDVYACPERLQSVAQALEEGHCNILVITKSLENLDLPKFNTVIRYNVFRSQVSYVRSAALCTDSGGRLVHMIEENNDAHRHILSDTMAFDQDMSQWAKQTMCSDEGAIPPRALTESLDPYRSDSEDELESVECIRDPTTGATIRKMEAHTVMHRLAASMQSKEIVYWIRPFFINRDVNTKADGNPRYSCTVVLPAASPIPTITGPTCATFAEARMEACYQACSILFDRGILDYRMFPQSQDGCITRSTEGVTATRKADEDIVTAVMSANTYRCFKKRPDFWTNCGKSFQGRLYSTIVSLSNVQEDDHAPILLLTRRALPELASFSIFPATFTAVAQFARAGALDISDEHLSLLHRYTERVCRAITNKPLAYSADDMPYFLAPLRKGAEEILRRFYGLGQHPSIAKYIPWELVRLAADNFIVPLLSDNGDSIEGDSVVQDRRAEFTNRFFVKKVRHDLSPLSKADDSPREAEYASFLGYCRARIKDFQGLKDEHQPLIEVARMPSGVSYLTPNVKMQTDSKPPVKYLIPELCSKSTIPASTFRTMLLMPSIMRRVDDQLLVKELNARFFQNSVNERQLLVALTTPSANAEFDYERLEFIGDAFLKQLASIYCFVTMPSAPQGALHPSRRDIVSNEALLSGANEAGLPPYIQSKPFMARLWQPVPPVSSRAEDDGVPVTIQNKSQGDQPKPSGKRSKRKKQEDDYDIQWLGAKTVADVVESLVGAAYISGGQSVALRVAKALHVGVPLVERWSDFAFKASVPLSHVTDALPAGIVQAVEGLLHCRFKKPQLLACALTHASIEGYGFTRYDRLEFIGDAVLDVLAVRHIYHCHPTLMPGDLSLLRSAMVSMHALAALCVEIGLHKHLRHNSKEIDSAIRAYVSQLRVLQNKEHRAAADERREPKQYWTTLEPPKVLSDIVESVIAALYVSDDFAEENVTVLFDEVMKPFYDRYVRIQTLWPQPIATLYELLTSYGCQRHSIVKERKKQTRCDVIVHGIVLAHGEGANVVAARSSAALHALDALNGDTSFMARTCDCRATSQQSQKGKKTNVDRAELGYEEE